MNSKLMIAIWMVLCVCCVALAEKHKNVLLICIDDLRPELGCYGALQVKSPHIDKLASEGILFERAYCSVPVCGPSRACLLSGLLPIKNRFNDWRIDTEFPDLQTLPQVFKKAGYYTLSAGKVFHHMDDCQERSWSEPPQLSTKGHMDSFVPATQSRLSEKKRGLIYEMADVEDHTYLDGRIAAKTIHNLRRMKKSGRQFFVACGFIRPHLPFYAPKKYWDLYDRKSIDTANNRFKPLNAPPALAGGKEYRYYHLSDYDVKSDTFHKMMRHGYYACVSYIDKLVGDVLGELETLGLAENTIIVLWGDHGWNLGEHNFWGKHNLVHNSLRVPLILKIPGRTNGQKSNALIETTDLYPTLCELVDLPQPEHLDGISFAGIINHPQSPLREHVYCRYKNGDTVLNERYAYTRYNIDENNIMLFDHHKDPQENENIVGNSKYKIVIKEMDRRLEESLKRASYSEAGIPK